MDSPNLSAHGYDLTLVRPLGGYPATQCPCRTQFGILPPEGVEPIPIDAVTQARFDAGNEFEAMVFANLIELHLDAVQIPEGPKGEMIDATVDAMEHHVPIILGGWLPDDELGRRTGKPDMLLYDVDGYLPVDVKVYTLFHAAEDAKTSALVSTLATVGLDAAMATSGTVSSSHRKKAALQLAHYWRMLQTCGQASSRGAFGAIIDSGEQLVWIDLNAADATIQNKKTHEDEPVTWLRSYDHEFEFRRDVAAHSELRKRGEQLEPKVQPVAITECGSCEWNGYCRPELEERDHISLLPWMSYWQHRNLRLAGLTRRRQIAERDYFTASVVSRLSAAQLRGVLDDANADTPLAELWKRAASVQPFAAELAAAGTVTAADLTARLTDELALDLAGALNPAWIDQARASVLGTPLLARGFTELDLPTYDVEVDFDMENDLTGAVYMWGLLVSRPTVGDNSVVEAGAPSAPLETTVEPYAVIDTYEPETDEVAIFLQFWNEANRLLNEATAAGQTFQMFYWSSAELSAAKRICTPPAELVETPVVEVPRSGLEATPVEPVETTLPTVEEVEAFFATHCTDLEAVLKKHFVTADGTSVKKIAPIAGHTWEAVYALPDADEDETAGGDISMIKHRLAVESDTSEARQSAITWLRTYNEADVEATRAVRVWMRRAVDELPRAENLDK